MPTEHEYKYVLSLSLLDEFDETRLGWISNSMAYIEQGYVAMEEGAATRIRHIRRVAPQVYGNSDVDHWLLTFKRTVGSRVIEVEKELDNRDGQDLWSVCARRITKVRYYFIDDDRTWELDLFKTEDHSIYFILAEVELPEGSPKPENMPFFLSKYLLYEVGLTDTRFSNKKLGNVDYTTELYRKIKEGVIDDHEG